MKRLQPIPDWEWPEAADHLRDGFATQLNVYRTMAHHAPLLNAWVPLRHHIVKENALGKQFSEVVILRTAHRLNAGYEWDHHVSRARACGMTDVRIASMAGPLEAMDNDDAILAGAVDELLDRQRLAQPAQEALQALVGVAGLFDIIASVGFYMTLGFIVKSFETPLDSQIVAELTRQPLVP